MHPKDYGKAAAAPPPVMLARNVFQKGTTNFLPSFSWEYLQSVKSKSHVCPWPDHSRE